MGASGTVTDARKVVCLKAEFDFGQERSLEIEEGTTNWSRILKADGWRVLTIWQCETKDERPASAQDLSGFLPLSGV